MPLHGKIVVIKRSGGDGTEFPLTAACLFGRKPDCDIRIQLPEVSKEHCRIDLNENKEVILTNLSSVNPTRVNGEILQQSERLKHRDVITIIDRSFRFEYPPPPTPKKRTSTGGKTKTFKVLQDQQVGDTVSTETGEKRVSEVSTDPHLKDGTNHDNIQRSLEKIVAVEPKEDDSLLQNKSTSPFNDLYQMIKKSLDVKTPRKSSTSLLLTPASRFCTPKPVSVRKTGGNLVISTEDKTSPKTDEAEVSSGTDETKAEPENTSNGTPKSVKKQRKSFQASSTEMAATEDEIKSEATSPLKRNRVTPQRFSVSEVIEQVSAQMPRSPMRRRSKEATPAKPVGTSPKSSLPKASPRNSEKFVKEETSQKRKSGTDSTQPQMKKKRVSFGGHLSPELFDKRLPPDSPLRRGATPRRSLCLLKPKQSLLRRASVIGLLQEFEQEHPDSPKLKTPSPGKKSPKSKSPSPKATTPGKKSPASRSPSPKATTPAKKSPSSRSPSPKASTPGKKSPKSRSPSPKATTPAKKSPSSRSPSPKATTPAKKSPSSRSPSPKATTPAKKSPKSRSPSPKAATPAKKSPKSRSPSPKAATPAKKSPASRSPSPKAATPAKKSPKSRSPSPKVPSPARRCPSQNKMETPGVQTPRVQGRFSVSHISTPSPIAEDAVPELVPSVTVTPKLPLRRKSMKSASRKTPSTAKSAVKVMRRSGMSRASLKVFNSWADIVKFGKTKTQVAAPAKKTTTQKKKQTAVPKPKTPARKLIAHNSTGHADSPVTIVVGRAHRQTVVHPTGAAPRLVTNTAVLKKNMKMDEDLTGISEMFKTPVTERKRRSVVNENSAMKTPVESLVTSMVEPSVLNTPEETGEMMVSPLNVSSSVKDGRYNSEAVQRLFNGDQESSFSTDDPARETHLGDSGEQQCTDLKTSVTTPKQKPEKPECLTGVKRIVKTPRQKPEPVEDLRGRLLKTPKQKPEQQECLTGVKRIMKTPKQRAEPLDDLRGKLLKTPQQKPEQQECLTAVKRIVKTPRQKPEPVEDLRGRLLKTPKQKPEQQECLTGVKRIMKTPKQRAEPLDDLRGKLLKTPQQKPEQQECLTAVKRIMKTPRQKTEPIEDLSVKILKTPKQKPEQQECLTGVKRIFETPQQEAEPLEDLKEKHLDTPEAPEAGCVISDDVSEIEETQAHMQDSEDLSEMMGMKTPDIKSSPLVCLSGIKRIMKTPKEKSAPVEDMVGVKRLVKTPREKSEPVEENFGIKRLVKSPRQKGNPPVDDFERLQELMEEPLTDPTGQLETNEVEDQTPPDCGVDVAKELDFAPEEPHDNTPSDVIDSVAQVDMEKDADTNEVVVDDRSEEVPSGHDNAESSDAMATISEAIVDENLPAEESKVDSVIKTSCEEQPKLNTNDENVSEEPAKMEAATGEELAIEAIAMDTDHEDKPVRGRRAKVVDSKPAEDKQEAAEHTEEPVIPAPVRGRRGKKAEATAPPAVRKTGRGKNAKSQENTSDDQTEMVPEKTVDTTLVAETATEAVSEQKTPANTNGEENDAAPPAEEAVVKPIRGRKAKQTPVEPPQPEPEINEAVSDELPVPDAQPQKSTSATGKPRRGRKTKADTEEPNEVAEEAVVTAETKEQSQPPVRAKRGRNAKQVEEKPEMTESICDVPKPKRGRNAKKASDDHTDQEVSTETDVVPEPESEQNPPADVEANVSAAPSEKAVPKAKRGRKAKPEQSVPEQEDVPCSHSDVLQADMEKDAKEVCSDQLEVLPSACEENKSSDATETVSRTPATESLPEEEREACKVPEMDPATVQKKPVRGRRAKVVDSKPAEDKQEAAEHTEEPVIPAPVRGRRGKKTEATAPPAVRKTGRGRNAKSQENTSGDQTEMVPEKTVDTTLVAETATEAVSEQKSPVNTNGEENDAAPPAEEAVVKPIRGRKTKQTPVEPPQPEPEINEAVSDELPVPDAQPQKSTSATGKPRRGRKTKADTEEPNEVAEEAVVTAETKEQSQPPLRAKRGRNAKQVEEKPASDSKNASVESTQEPVQKIRRTRKVEQDCIEPREEIQTVELVTEKPKAPLVAEPVKINEQAALATKPRRGGRKAKQDTESETPVESTEVQEVPALSSTDKQKRGRRGKQVPEEVKVTAVVPEEKSEHEIEAEELNQVEPDTPVVKRGRARGVKNEVSQTIPAKRGHRSAVAPPEETSAESTVQVTESASAPVQLARRGRRGAIKPTADDAAVTSDQTNSIKDVSGAVVEDTQMSKKSVKWRTNLEVFEIPEVTPVKASRGRRSKLGDQVDTESKNAAQHASKTEEKNLSGKVAKAQPAKRARREAKVADEDEPTSKRTSDESETQPKTRRGRSAKK